MYQIVPSAQARYQVHKRDTKCALPSARYQVRATKCTSALPSAQARHQVWLKYGCGCGCVFVYKWHAHTGPTHTLDMDAIQLKAQSQEENLRATVERIKLSGHVEEIKITTMTVLVMLEYSVNLEKIRRYPFGESEGPEGPEGPEGTVSLCSTCGFYNSLLLKVCNASRGKKVAVKVFSNGNLHMTGVCDLFVAVDTGKIVCDLLNKIFSTDVYAVHDFDVQLINCCLRYKLPPEKCVCLKTLYKKLLNDSKYFCIFNNDYHAGLRIKIVYTPSVHTSSVILFENGNALINAFVSGDELGHAFDYLRECLSSYEAGILLNSQHYGSTASRPKTKNSFDYLSYLVLR
ncbi:hypothetical protein EBU95_05240 [bacterium]|nr:hypothetical protein [bacterium]